jgi:hypothetical protein
MIAQIQTPEDRRKFTEYQEEFGDSKPILGVPAPEFHWLRWKVRNDLFFLMAEIFGMKDSKDRKSRRLRIDQVMHKQMAKNFMLEEDHLDLWPRNHLKTTFMKGRVVQLVLQNPNNRVAIWSRTAGLARKELKSIKKWLFHRKLVNLFPEILAHDDGTPLGELEWEKSDQDGMTIRRLDEYGYIPQEHQIEVYGIEATVTGNHYDYHIYDDIINEQSVRTPDQLEKVRVWWDHVQEIKELSGVELMIGTRYHIYDIYGQIISEKYFDKVTTRKAIENGRPIYKFYKLSDYKKLRKRISNHTWSCQWMNQAIPEEDRIFAPPYPFYIDLPESQYTYYIGVDPAFTATQFSDETGIAVGAVPETKNKIFFEEAYDVKLKSDQLADHLVALIARYKPRRMGIEGGLFDSLKYIIELKLKEHEIATGQRIRPTFVRISQGKENKAIKLSNGIGAFLKAQRAIIKKSPRTKKMLDEASLYNPHSPGTNKDNILDAANICIMTVPHFMQGNWIGVEEEKAPGLTFDSFREKPAEGFDWRSQFTA